MQSLFIQPIAKFYLFRKSFIVPLRPYSMSYIRLSYDETILIEFNGSKLKINSFLSHLNRHTPSPFLSSSSSSFTFKLSTMPPSLSLTVQQHPQHHQATPPSQPPADTHSSSPAAAATPKQQQQPCFCGCFHGSSRRPGPGPPPTVTTRLTVDWVNRVITGFVSQETEITLPKLKERGHKLFNVTNSAKSQNQHLTNTQDNHTIFYKSDITSTAKTNIHLSKNLIQNYKFLSAQLNIHPWNAIQAPLTHRSRPVPICNQTKRWKQQKFRLN